MAGMMVDLVAISVAGMATSWGNFVYAFRIAGSGSASLGKIGNADRTGRERDFSFHRHVIRPRRAPRGGVGGGVDARERLELVGEVRLIVISAVEGELCPGHVRARVQPLHCPLESPDATPDFR